MPCDIQRQPTTACFLEMNIGNAIFLATMSCFARCRFSIYYVLAVIVVCGSNQLPVSVAFLFGMNFGIDNNGCEAPCIPGDESIMRIKEHGTSNSPVQSTLRWSCDVDLADKICNFNRHYAEQSGYLESSSIRFLPYGGSSDSVEPSEAKPVVFYDSNTGNEVFRAPVGRSWDDFINESRRHGWPSFRDQEVGTRRKFSIIGMTIVLPLQILFSFCDFLNFLFYLSFSILRSE